MESLNLWLNIAIALGVAIIGYGGWKALASKTAMDTIGLLKEELDAVRRRLDSRDAENKELLKQVTKQSDQIRELTTTATEAKVEAEQAKALNRQQAIDIERLQQAVGRLARRLEIYEGQEPVETLADQESHEALNRATIDEGWLELERRGIKRARPSAPGSQGVQGIQGIQGIQGTKGAPGAPGRDAE